MAENFTSRQVLALTGISPRQLQWWDEQGLVSAARQGRNRLYSMADVAEISVISELRGKGFSLQRVRKIIRFLQREMGTRLIETLSSGGELHLLTDGQHIYLETSARQVIDILKSSRQPIFTICLSDTLRQIRAELRGKKMARATSPERRSRRRSA